MDTLGRRVANDGYARRACNIPVIQYRKSKRGVDTG